MGVVYNTLTFSNRKEGGRGVLLSMDREENYNEGVAVDCSQISFLP